MTTHPSIMESESSLVECGGRTYAVAPSCPREPFPLPPPEPQPSPGFLNRQGMKQKLRRIGNGHTCAECDRVIQSGRTLCPQCSHAIYLPTPEQIAVECAAIRAEWGDNRWDRETGPAEELVARIVRDPRLSD